MDNYGATPEEWGHFGLYLGETNNLLPVVSNPNAKISPNSTLKEKGKVPSLYNAQGEVVGISDWTSQVSSYADIKKWGLNKDLGICIQTKTVRALDIDVPDRLSAMKIVNFIKDKGYDFPMRMRENSGKCLLIFKLPGEMAKRTLQVEGGIIEFLATGQQFIAAGTHTSGVRYEWDGGLPEAVPELTLEQFNELWTMIIEHFAIAVPVTGSLRNPKVNGQLSIVKDDDVVTFLLEKGLSLGRGKEGQVFITCPFAAEHTGDSGVSATVYMPPGGRMYQKGHFNCKHAHCAGRTDDDFEKALGIVENGFHKIAPAECGTGAGPVSPPDLPPFQRNKTGRIYATVENVRMGVRCSSFCGWQVAYDEFKGEIVLAPHEKTLAWRPLQDTDYFGLRLALEMRDFLPVSKEMVRDTIHFIANENRVDTAGEWLKSLTWDGVPRVEGFMKNYMFSEDTPYATSISRYMWTALAGRVMEPGIKADMVPIWEGNQGMGKSMAVAAIAPDPVFYTEIGFHEHEDKVARKLKGVVVAEISELRGLKTRDSEMIKAFITRTHDKWVPKYVENVLTYPRRVLFIGTTNQTELLEDDTGNRRWLPINVGNMNNADVTKIVTDRDMLWAEGRDLFLKSGVAWQDAKRLAPVEHEKYRQTDSWEDKISAWLDTVGLDDKRPVDREYLMTGDVLTEAIGLQVAGHDRRFQLRVGRILKTFGYINKQKWVNNRNTRVFLKP